MTYTFTIRPGAQFHDPTYGTVTPADVEYSYERWMVQDRSGGPTWMILEPLFGVHGVEELGDLTVPAEVAAVGQMIDDAVTSDATTVTLNLAMPYAPLLTILAQSWASILSEAWCTAHDDFPGFDDTGYDGWIDFREPEVSPLDDYPVGTGGAVMMGSGPYMFDYWDRGVEYSFVKFDDYWGGWPASHPTIGTARGYLTRVTEKFIDEWATRKLLFLAGDVDFCYVPIAHLPEMEPFPEVIRCDYPLTQIVCSPVFFFSYNISTTSPLLGPGFDDTAPYTIAEDRIPINFFNDIDVRKGFIQTFDFVSYLRDVFQSEGQRQYAPVPEPLEYYKEDLTGYVMDMDAATTALQNAWGGQLWTTGFTIDLSYNTGNEVRRIASEMLKAGVESINPKFHVNVVEVPWPTFLGYLVNFELGGFVLGWLADFPDAHNFILPFMHPFAGDFTYFQSVQYGQSGRKQIAPYGDPALDIDNQYVADMITAGIESTDPAERETIYYELQEIYIDEIPSVPLAYATGRHWERTWVAGWYYNAIFPGFGGCFCYHMWKEELATEDLDMNGAVDIFDIVRLAGAFGSFWIPGAAHPDWDSRADLNQDEVVDIFDVVLIAKQFGATAPPWTPP
jgi:peptide/nickel transport system substrate-binding protein